MPPMCSGHVSRRDVAVPVQWQVRRLPGKALVYPGWRALRPADVCRESRGRGHAPPLGHAESRADARSGTVWPIPAHPMSQTGSVDAMSPKSGWADRLPSGPPLRDELARLVDSDGGRDPAENGYFESANDPQFTVTEIARRRFKGQLRRRLRHLASRARGRTSE